MLEFGCSRSILFLHHISAITRLQFEVSMTRVLRTIVVFALFLCASPSFAWCLAGRSCATDDSVCDMGPNTTRILGARTFVWSQAKREVEIYRRLASAEILNNCADRQKLILQSDGSLQFDRSILPEVAKRFCTVADIATTPIPGRYPGTPGFEVSCMITKMAEARRFHAEQEAQISTAQMIAEDNRKPSQRDAPDDQSPAKQSSDDCNKWSLGMIFGLPGRCTGR